MIHPFILIFPGLTRPAGETVGLSGSSHGDVFLVGSSLYAPLILPAAQSSVTLCLHTPSSVAAWVMEITEAPLHGWLPL
jgi:hypothetical protein